MFRESDSVSFADLATRMQIPKIVQSLMEQDGDPTRTDSYGVSVTDLASASAPLARMVTATHSVVETHGPSSCVVDEIPVLHCGRTLWFILQSKDSFLRHRTRGGDPIEVRIHHADSLERPCPARIKDMGNGTYRILWRTNSEGHHKVSIKIRGKHISGSPFGVDVHPRSPVSSNSDVPFDTASPAQPSLTQSLSHNKVVPDPVPIPSPQIGIAKRKKKSKSESTFGDIFHSWGCF